MCIYEKVMQHIDYDKCLSLLTTFSDEEINDFLSIISKFSGDEINDFLSNLQDLTSDEILAVSPYLSDYTGIKQDKIISILSALVHPEKNVIGAANESLESKYLIQHEVETVWSQILASSTLSIYEIFFSTIIKDEIFH